ncbi:hypothetical protein SAMN05421545_3289 [Pontibacter lucknowensis]|uniref:Uncharacterized protein n=1 Tax=Pontibacter lucknowensis TaxID=1077936 RepID=A0A1N7A7Q6_9BACT|nr:hypothetical protein SAMN05421545_3289 [Pontibacter lucknowensis]
MNPFRRPSVISVAISKDLVSVGSLYGHYAAELRVILCCTGTDFLTPEHEPEIVIFSFVAIE